MMLSVTLGYTFLTTLTKVQLNHHLLMFFVAVWVCGGIGDQLSWINRGRTLSTSTSSVSRTELLKHHPLDWYGNLKKQTHMLIHASRLVVPFWKIRSCSFFGQSSGLEQLCTAYSWYFSLSTRAYSSDARKLASEAHYYNSIGSKNILEIKNILRCCIWRDFERGRPFDFLHFFDSTVLSIFWHRHPFRYCLDLLPARILIPKAKQMHSARPFPDASTKATKPVVKNRWKDATKLRFDEVSNRVKFHFYSILSQV